MTETNPNKKEAVEPVNISVTSSELPSSPARHHQSWSISFLFWAGLLLLLLLASYVLFLLPHTIEEIPPSKITSSTKEEEIVAPPELEVPVATSSPEAPAVLSQEDQQTKTQAENLLTELIQLESILERHGIQRWAAEDYANAVAKGKLGDEQFRQQNFAAATETYQHALNNFRTLEQRIQPTLEDALSRGEQALSQGDRLAAIHQFELAQIIDADNVRASNGLQRAATIEQLFTLLQRGSSFESHLQLQQAKSIYQEAIKLDPLSGEAEKALARVNSKLINQEFNQAIARGYDALQNRQYADARAAFQAARNIKKQSQEPVTGLNKVAAAIREEKISSLLFEAEHFVQLQQWQQAAETYEKIVQLDSTHQIAQRGFQDSSLKAKLIEDLKSAIDTADQLHQPQVLNNAKGLLETVEHHSFTGSIMQSHAEELRKLVRAATTPISIVLESDEQTEVTIYKVARLGKFKRRELQLRPGPYTIVGSRNGYRDVRKKFRVSKDGQQKTVSIHCDEPI